MFKPIFMSLPPLNCFGNMCLLDYCKLSLVTVPEFLKYLLDVFTRQALISILCWYLGGGMVRRELMAQYLNSLHWIQIHDERILLVLLRENSQ